MKRLATFLLITFLTVYSMTWLLAGGKEALIPFLGAVPNVPVVQGASGGTPLNTAMSAAADISGSSTLQHAGDAFTINVQGYGAVAFQIVGTLATNTIQWQSTLDGVTYDVFNVTSQGYSGGLFQSVNSATFYTGMVLEGATAAVNQLKFTTTGELGGLCTVYWRLSPLTIPGLNLTVTPLKSYFVPGADAVGTTATLANELNNAIYVLTRPQVYNGATWDRGRGANAAANTTGTGLLGTGLLGYDATNWQYLGVNGSHALKVDGSAVTQPVSGTFWQATQPISGTVTANQGGTWTVQPGNTANTTAWKVDGSAVTQPVTIPTTAGNYNGLSPLPPAAIYGVNATSNGAFIPANVVAGVTGGLPSASENYLVTYALRAFLNNTGTGYVPQAERNPSVFRVVTATASGSTALETPTTGTRFRLMRWRYTFTENATTAGGANITIALLDGAATMNQSDVVTVPAVALSTAGQLAASPWIDLGNGILAAGANDVCNVNLSAALATGSCNVQACFTEE